MVTVYVCTIHYVARVHTEEPWSRDKYERAIYLRHQLHLVEDTCHRCLERAQHSLDCLIEARQFATV